MNIQQSPLPQIPFASRPRQPLKYTLFNVSQDLWVFSYQSCKIGLTSKVEKSCLPRRQVVSGHKKVNKAYKGENKLSICGTDAYVVSVLMVRDIFPRDEVLLFDDGVYATFW